MSILIKNGTVVNEDAMFKADVLITDGKIASVGENLTAGGGNIQVLDATDRFVIPGGIDPHTHLQMPFMGQVAADDFYNGTRAAVAGGTTMVIDFAIPSKTMLPLASYKQWREWADPKVCCDYGLSMAITFWSPDVEKEMEEVVKPEYGVNSFKFFLAYSGAFMVRDEEFYQGMLTCARIGAVARVHAENGSVIAERCKALLKEGVTGPEGHTQSRPEELEAEATNRACMMATQANCPLYVVHVMSRGAAKAIAEHRQKGYVVFGEPIAAGLALDGSHYWNPDWMHAARYVMSPPLSRDPSTKEALMDMLAAGQLHLVGTDNCTFTSEQKKMGLNDFTKIPNGVNGIEDRMSIVWEKGVHSGKIDPMRFVQVTSAMAAKIFNVYPRKGRIAIGSDADVVIWNPKLSRAIDYNVFEGQVLHGVAETTISRGKIVWMNNKLNVQAGAGQFVPLLPFAPIAYASNAQKAQAQAFRSVKREAKPEAQAKPPEPRNPAGGNPEPSNPAGGSNISTARS
ncbi:dihydropyrimidinase [Ancylostoma ceylanicum]|uniref:dihydropyrimidinase n=1 Tax=Ancylostoma ceylanicum TaxID=53326 RepID=A0A0D6LGB6_9BILA|nr:dihydropyrimidinase [Ancylostoma ceylanicum]